MSIVLVIIGLIVSGVLVGKDLVQTSRLNQTVQEMQQVQSSFTLFDSKYGYLPGDYLIAKTTWPSCASDCNGNGDRRISNGQETRWVWEHLALAGMIAGGYKGAWGTPKERGVMLFPSEYNKKAGYNSYYDGNRLYGMASNVVVLASSSPTSTGWQAGTVSAKDAYDIDKKIDDGSPGRGKIRVRAGYNAVASSWYATANCRDAQGYVISNNDAHCTLGYYMD